MSITTQKWLRVLIAVGLVAYFFSPRMALAARPDSLSVTMSDSRPSITTAVHTVALNESSATSFGANDTIILTYQAGFTLTNLTYADVTFNDNGTSKTTAANCTTTTNVQFVVSSNTITFTACSAYTTGGTGGLISIGLGAAGSNRITNASAGGYTVTVTGTYGDDSQVARVMVLAVTTATATIAETLTFTVGAVNNAACQVGSSSNVTTTATTVPFGTVNSDTFYAGCQSLTVGTNGSGGYTVTVQSTGSFATSGGNVIAKGTCDGSCSDSTAAAWATAASHSGYGYCMIDSTHTAATNADANWGTHPCGASQYFKTIANSGSSQAAQTIMSQVASTTTNDVANIGYRLTVGPGQAAGTYTTTAVYVVTPTF